MTLRCGVASMFFRAGLMKTSSADIFRAISIKTM